MLDEQFRTGNKKYDEKIEMALEKDPSKPSRLVRIGVNTFKEEEKQNKYHIAEKEDRTYSDGTLFASQGEMERWHELLMYERAGQIKDLRRQVIYELQEAFISRQYGDVPAVSYVSDFTYINISLRKGFEGREIVEDHKGGGMRTDAYKIKRKLFLYKYGGLLFFEV